MIGETRKWGVFLFFSRGGRIIFCKCHQKNRDIEQTKRYRTNQSYYIAKKRKSNTVQFLIMALLNTTLILILAIFVSYYISTNDSNLTTKVTFMFFDLLGMNPITYSHIYYIILNVYTYWYYDILLLIYESVEIFLNAHTFCNYHSVFLTKNTNL